MYSVKGTFCLINLYEMNPIKVKTKREDNTAAIFKRLDLIMFLLLECKLQ